MSAPLAAMLGQQVALSLMTDTCQIYRLDYDHPTAGAGGKDAYARTDLYTGQCRIRPASEARVSGSPTTAGDSAIVVESFMISVPLSVTAVEAHDLLQVTASADPRLAGRIFKLVGMVAGSQVTARRMLCEQVSP